MHFATAVLPTPRGLGLVKPTLSLPLPIPDVKFTLIGHSRAADSTAFYIPELSLALDAGPGAPVHSSRPAVVLITHGHSDHSYGMTGLVSRTKPPKVYIPSVSAKAMGDYLFASQILTNATEIPMTREEYTSNHVIEPVKPGSVALVQGKAGNGIEAQVFRCDHTCECVGYALFRVRDVLREDLKGKSGAELARLKKAGESITQPLRTPLFAFCGDTTPAVFTGPDAAAWLDGMPVVITECTFLHEKHRDNAERTKHTLWSDLEPVIRARPGTTFVLIHFSHQYTHEGITSFFNDMTDAPENVVIWLDTM